MKLKQDIDALMKAVMSQPTVEKYQAGRIFSLGRRLTDQAVREGMIPVIGPKEVVSTAWIRKTLEIES